MAYKIALIIIIIIVVIYLYWHSSMNVSSFYVCEVDICGTHKVHIAHANREDAAKLMGDIKRRIDKLLIGLEKKYTIHKKLPKELTDNGILIQDRVNQLLENYDPNNISEISPLNKTGATSYTENKTHLVLCLRKKEKNKEGIHELHDRDVVMFVVLHELAHMMNDRWGHPIEFWRLFKLLLEDAQEMGVYKPRDFEKHPVNYCGLDLTYNPIYDANIL